MDENEMDSRLLLNYTEEQLRNENLSEIERLSQHYELSKYDGLIDNLEITLTHLVLLMLKEQAKSHSSILKTFETMEREGKEKCTKLIHILEEVVTALENIPTDIIESLSGVLNKDNLITDKPDQEECNILTEIKDRIELLQKRESNVVIAGETNGGKSSLLNLLLGENILPASGTHCTLTVTKIKYGENYKVEYTDIDGRRHCQIFDSACKTKHFLENVVKGRAISGEGVRESCVHEATVYCPSPILRSGITLVDTPGIGEDEEIDKLTSSYIEKAHPDGFVYVIKSDTAGGIHEDRLLRFLRAIKEGYKSGHYKETFDPRSAIFLAHRWDMLKDEKEQETVRKNALKRLEFVWPGFQHSQLFYFSTKDAERHFKIDKELMTSSFHRLLGELKQLFTRANRTAIKHQYVWLKFALSPISRHIQAMISHCCKTKEELDEYFRNISAKQTILKEKAAENADQIKQCVELETKELVEKIKDFLSFSNSRPQNELPDFEDLLTFTQEQKHTAQQVDEEVFNSLLRFIDTRIQANDLVDDLEKSVLESLTKHLGLFKEQVTEIKSEMKSNMTRTASQKSIASDTSSSLGSSYSRNVEDIDYKSPLNMAAVFQSMIDTKMDRRQTKRTNSKRDFFGTLGRLTNIFSKSEKSGRSEKFLENKCKKVADKIRKDENLLLKIVSYHLEWVKECVDKATKSIPRFIEVNDALMLSIREERAEYYNSKETLKQTMLDLEPCRKQLRGYGSLYMQDVNADALNFNAPRHNSFVNTKSLDFEYFKDSGFGDICHSSRNYSNMWTLLRSATIEVENHPTDVMVKTYKTSEDPQLDEIALLRTLKHANVADFFGMTRTDITDQTTQQLVKLSAFIFEGNLVCVREYFSMESTDKRIFAQTMPKELLLGLDYIHGENLVHIVLNTDSVMVEKNSGIVKLTHHCKPQTLSLPPDLDTCSSICLSPNVLQGLEYTFADDIYAFGILLWQLLFPDKPPYEAQLELPFHEFLKCCHPRKMLGPVLEELNMSLALKELLQRTLFMDRASLPMSTDEMIKTLNENLRHEPAILKLKTNVRLETRLSVPCAPTPKTPSSPDTASQKRRSRRGSLPSILPMPSLSDPREFFLPKHSKSIDSPDSSSLHRNSLSSSKRLDLTSGLNLGSVSEDTSDSLKVPINMSVSKSDPDMQNQPENFDRSSFHRRSIVLPKGQRHSFCKKQDGKKQSVSLDVGSKTNEITSSLGNSKDRRYSLPVIITPNSISKPQLKSKKPLTRMDCVDAEDESESGDFHLPSNFYQSKSEFSLCKNTESKNTFSPSPPHEKVVFYQPNDAEESNFKTSEEEIGGMSLITNTRKSRSNSDELFVAPTFDFEDLSFGEDDDIEKTLLKNTSSEQFNNSMKEDIDKTLSKEDKNGFFLAPPVDCLDISFGDPSDNDDDNNNSNFTTKL